MAARGAGAAASHAGDRVSRQSLAADLAAVRPLVAFRTGLEEAGFVEGQNVTIEYRWARGAIRRLPALAAELVAPSGRRDLCVWNAVPARAAKAATSTIPIVFAYGGDPVADGLVASLNRPGGNVTGRTFITAALAAKRLELLRELVPNADTVGVLVNPNNPSGGHPTKRCGCGARGHSGSRCISHTPAAKTSSRLPSRPSRGSSPRVLLGTDTIFFNRRDQLIALAASHRIPADLHISRVCPGWRLDQLRTDFRPKRYRQAGLYAGRILKGAKPADLPVLQPTKFELVINLKTAKALGLEVPPFLLARADEVIE